MFASTRQVGMGIGLTGGAVVAASLLAGGVAQAEPTGVETSIISQDDDLITSAVANFNAAVQPAADAGFDASKEFGEYTALLSKLELAENTILTDSEGSALDIDNLYNPFFNSFDTQWASASESFLNALETVGSIIEKADAGDSLSLSQYLEVLGANLQLDAISVFELKPLVFWTDVIDGIGAELATYVS